jgi:hypothetical protein
VSSLARPTSLCRSTESTVCAEFNFNNVETHAANRSFLQAKARKKILTFLNETLYILYAPWYANVYNWVAQFKHGDFSACDAPSPGRPKTVTATEIIVQIHEIMLEECWTLAK